MILFEYFYYIGYSIKKSCSARNRKRLPLPVISIGNLTLGGTGKTPAAMALARKASETGLYPCILTRGYKGRAHGPCFVSKGEGPLLDASQAGDEAVLLAERLSGVPIVKGKNRYEAGMFILEKLKFQNSNFKAPNLFILDDGFQHWALHRDKDILLIDSTNPFGNRKLFPLGPLREPLSAMKRADIIVITNAFSPYLSPSERDGKAESAESRESSIRSLAGEIRLYAPSAPLYFAHHRPTAFIKTSGNTLSLSETSNKKVFAFCGIGNPKPFKDTLFPLIGELKGLMVFKDHHQYNNAEIRMITGNAEKSGADWIVTTEKDIMRLKTFSLPDNVLALRIEFDIDEKFFDDVLDRRRELSWLSTSM